MSGKYSEKHQSKADQNSEVLVLPVSSNLLVLQSDHLQYLPCNHAKKVGKKERYWMDVDEEAQS